MIIKIFLFLSIIIILVLLYDNVRKHNVQKQVNKLFEIQTFLVDNYMKERQTKHFKDKIRIPIYYINLDHSLERRQHIESQIEMYNINNIKRVSGIFGALLDLSSGMVDFNGRSVRYSNNFDASNSELGCLFSHYKAIYTAHENGDEYALILEDDVSFALLPYWPINLHDVMNDAPEGWCIISLYKQLCFDNKEPYIKYGKGNACYSALAYIINRKGMENCLKSIYENNTLIFDKTKQKFPPDLGSDTWIYYTCGDMYWYNKLTLFFSYNDGTNMNSTIHTDHTSDHITRALRSVSTYLVERNGEMSIRNAWSSNRKIPHILHQIWFDWNGTGIPEKYKTWSNKCQEIHSDWQYWLWDEKMALEFMSTNYSWFLNTYNNYDKPIKRVDALRYFILYHYGGVYIDMDFICLKNLEELLIDGNAIFGYQYEDISVIDAVCNAFMASPDKHPLFENLIYALEGSAIKDVIKATGPTFLTTQIQKYYGTDIIIYKMPIIYTHEWHENKFGKCKKSYELCKQQFPNSYTTTSWGGGWK